MAAGETRGNGLQDEIEIKEGKVKDGRYYILKITKRKGKKYFYKEVHLPDGGVSQNYIQPSKDFWDLWRELEWSKNKESAEKEKLQLEQKVNEKAEEVKEEKFEKAYEKMGEVKEEEEKSEQIAYGKAEEAEEEQVQLEQKVDEEVEDVKEKRTKRNFVPWIVFGSLLVAGGLISNNYFKEKKKPARLEYAIKPTKTAEQIEKKDSLEEYRETEKTKRKDVYLETYLKKEEKKVSEIETAGKAHKKKQEKKDSLPAYIQPKEDTLDKAEKEKLEYKKQDKLQSKVSDIYIPYSIRIKDCFYYTDYQEPEILENPDEVLEVVCENKDRLKKHLVSYIRSRIQEQGFSLDIITEPKKLTFKMWYGSDKELQLLKEYKTALEKRLKRE